MSKYGYPQSPEVDIAAHVPLQSISYPNDSSDSEEKNSRSSLSSANTLKKNVFIQHQVHICLHLQVPTDHLLGAHQLGSGSPFSRPFSYTSSTSTG